MLGISTTLTEVVFVYLCNCAYVYLYLHIRQLGTLFLRSLYHYLFKYIAHTRHNCNFDPSYICVFVYLCICICVFASQTPRNIVSEVLLPLTFQKYSTCHVYLHLWPMLYLRICVFVYLYLCICKSDTREHCFWGPCIITFQKMYGLYGLKHHTVEIRGGVTRRDDKWRTNNGR